MAIINRLHAAERDRIEGQKSPAATQPAPDVLNALEGMLTVEAAKSGEPRATAQPGPALAPTPVQAPTAAAAPLSQEQASPGFLKRTAENNVQRRESHRAALDYLNILKSLAPVFKAAFVYPGHDAAPEQVGIAVRKMSQVSVDLADYIATHGDKLELDAAWARKTLHDFTADLVANHWIATVLGKGGVVPGHSPNISVDFFVPAVRAVLQLPTDLPLPAQRANNSLAGGVQLSLLKAMTPIVLEMERFADVVNARVPSKPVLVDKLVADLRQFIMDQSTAHYEKFVVECGALTEDDKRMMLQALISHASGVLLTAWEHSRGEVLGAIKDAESAQKAAEILARPQFTHGFPLQALKQRAAESLRRLAGTSQYALSLMRQSAENANAKGA